MVPTLTEACYAIMSMDHIRNMNTLKSIYYAHFHSVLKYGIILGDSSNSGKIFTLQKKIFSVMVNAAITYITAKRDYAPPVCMW